jgi:6,7-dimethyl-8-ribityllumazine synthase
MLKKEKNKIAIIVSDFNKKITQELLKGTLETLEQHSIYKENIMVIKVSGALEIPGTINMIIKYNAPEVIIALGAVIKGETAHFETVAKNSSRLISQLSIQHEIPIINGVLTTYDVSQALERASIQKKNKGAEFARAAIQMLNTYDDIKHSQQA